MRTYVSQRVQSVPPSGIRRFFDIAATMKNVISGNGKDGVYVQGDGQGLVSWYKAQNNTNDSVSNNNGALKGAASFGPGKSGQGFVLNGTNAYVDVPSTPSLKLTSALTVSAWLNLAVDPSTVTASAIAVKGVDVEGPVDWALTVTGTSVQIKGPGHLRPHVNVNGTWTYFDGNTALQPHQWYFAVMTYDGSNLPGCPDALICIDHLEHRFDEPAVRDFMLSAADRPGSSGGLPLGWLCALGPYQSQRFAG